MKVDNFLIRSFSDNENKQIYSIDVPIGSKLLVVKAVPEGIRAWYQTPSLDVDFRQDRFIILGHAQEIPSEADFVAIIDIIVGDGEDQKVIILPVFKLP